MADYLDDLIRNGQLESIKRPSPARVYDYFLGGHHNYAIDREFAERRINEPIAHAHAEILLDREADPERHKAVIADFHRTEDLWDKMTDTGLLRPDEPGIC